MKADPFGTAGGEFKARPSTTQHIQPSSLLFALVLREGRPWRLSSRPCRRHEAPNRCASATAQARMPHVDRSRSDPSPGPRNGQPFVDSAMTFLSRTIPVSISRAIFFAALIVLGGINTWHRYSLQWKVQYLAEHHLPASMALTADWQFVPGVVAHSLLLAASQQALAATK